MANLVRIVCRPAWLLVATLLGALGVFSNAAADGPWMDLQDYFDDLQSFRADFVQEVRRGAARDVSRGVVVLQTPNRFRWDKYPALPIAPDSEKPPVTGWNWP